MMPATPTPTVRVPRREVRRIPLAAPGLRAWLVLAMSLASGPAWTATLAGSLHHDWHLPRAQAFAAETARLAPALQSLCAASPEQAGPALEGARSQWRASLAAWERLAGVALGPVLERRSQRAIDFTPTRPRMIEKAILARPKTTADLELIGTPAKGLPALEWLLWVKPVPPGSPACDYAVRLAEDVDREARALVRAPVPAQDDATALAELVNQWVGGVERLRWPGMDMPVRVALTAKPPETPDFPRRESGSAALAWAAQWDALRSLAVAGPASLAGRLRLGGQVEQAAALIAAVTGTEAAMQGLASGDTARVLAAARALAGLKHQVESQVAPALGISIGFSDADGD